MAIYSRPYVKQICVLRELWELNKWDRIIQKKKFQVIWQLVDHVGMDSGTSSVVVYGLSCKYKKAVLHGKDQSRKQQRGWQKHGKIKACMKALNSDCASDNFTD